MNELVKNDLNEISEKNSKELFIYGEIKPEEKIDVFNKIMNCETAIDSKVFGKKLKLKVVAMQQMAMENGTNAMRQIYITEDGKSYISFSNGIYKIMRNLLKVFGAPPYEFSVVFKEINKGKIRLYTMQICKDDEDVKNDLDDTAGSYVEDIFA